MGSSFLTRWPGTMTHTSMGSQFCRDLLPTLTHTAPGIFSLRRRRPGVKGLSRLHALAAHTRMPTHVRFVPPLQPQRRISQDVQGGANSRGRGTHEGRFCCIAMQQLLKMNTCAL